MQTPTPIQMQTTAQMDATLDAITILTTKRREQISGTAQADVAWRILMHAAARLEREVTDYLTGEKA